MAEEKKISEEKKVPRREYLKYAGLSVAGVAVGAAATAGVYEATRPPPVAPPPTPTPGPAKFWIPPGKMWIPILNRFMTFDEVREEIRREGKMVLANWTYWGLIDTYFVPEFKEYVRERYGVDVDIEILGTQPAKGFFMLQVYSALAAGKPAPYDVMHLEDNFFWGALMKKVAEPFLPSPLVPNAQFVDAHFLRFPCGIQFQQHATCNLTVNTKYVDWMKSWLDLADPRLKGKITLWEFTDNGFWGLLAAVCAALGGDWKNAEDMEKAIEWTAENIHPNVLKYTSDEADIMENLEREVSWIGGYWCCLAEGYALTKPHLKAPILEPWMPNLPGVYWIPKNSEHPVLAQIACDWLISPEHQFTDIEKWPVVDKEKWLMMEEGPLGHYYEQFEPGWSKELGPKGIYEVYPTLEEAKTKIATLDWEYMELHAEEWIRRYQELI